MGPYFAGGVFWASCAEPATVGAAVARCGARGLAGSMSTMPRLASCARPASPRASGTPAANDLEVV